jgi:xylan 1,4-beta-xylosidase
MVWNYHDEDIAAEASKVKLVIKNIPVKKVLLQHYRIDAAHSNAYEAWKKMGSPQNPTEEQYRILEKEGQLQLLNSPGWIKMTNGDAVIDLLLPRQGVSLLRLNY